MKAKDKVVKALKGQVARAEKDRFMRANIRIDSPITFKGANKILSAVVIDDTEWTKDLNNDEIDFKDYSPVQLKVVYGKIGKDLEKQYKEFVGSNYKITKGRL